MLINYYEDGALAPVRTSRTLLALLIANGIFSTAIIFAWTYVSLIVAEPLSWATWMPVDRGYGWLGLLEYPFVLLWGLPLVGMFGAWMSMQAGKRLLSYSFVGVPLVMLTLVMGWYYLAPTAWH